MESRITWLQKKHNIDIPFIKIDIRDIDNLKKIFKDYRIKGIIHTAALKSVAESNEKKEEYLAVNHIATREILKIAQKNGVEKFIFSSTAAIYGNVSESRFCEEDDLPNPISNYGLSKVLAEEEVSKSNSESDLLGTSLRFFNVVGAAAPALRDSSVANLVPIVINKINSNNPIEIFGDDYLTKDGTCIRDYVDVRDIAKAHSLVANSGVSLPNSINIGTGIGVSVQEIISMILRLKEIEHYNVLNLGRRHGDPDFLCANVNLAREILKFKAQYAIDESIGTVIF